MSPQLSSKIYSSSILNLLFLFFIPILLCEFSRICSKSPSLHNCLLQIHKSVEDLKMFLN
ncbi:unnamed protein product [Meloidogyne enterolobii]|uniref:Uncharacterized protein n=1 Tax=Meloidogyne enterolobii TaxID=390850 RepID=A0ACB0YJ33_MELEN